MNIVVKGGTVLSDKVYEDFSVVIEGNKIIDVGPTDDISRKYGCSGYYVINAKGKLVMPGLINAHTHIAMTLLRGYADDLSLQEWLEKWIWPVESVMSDEDIELGAMLGAIECLLNGVTTVCSLYHYNPERNDASAAIKVGLREVFAVAMFSWDEERSVKNVEDAVKRWHGAGGGLIRIALAPHAPYTVSPTLWRLAAELRKEYDERYGNLGRIIITSHVLEDPEEPNLVRERFKAEVPSNSVYKYLEDLGVLSEYFLAAHSIHVNDVDLAVMKKHRVKVAHNPVANMKLAMGISPVPKLIENDIIVSLGTDGPASNNTLDMFETMKVAALIHKAVSRDPRTLPASMVFRMATEWGALSLAYDNLGAIKKGYLADLVILDYKKPHLTPSFNPISHVVYAVRSSDVNTVIINGNLIVEDRRVLTVDVEEIMNRASKRAYELIEKRRSMQ